MKKKNGLLKRELNITFVYIFIFIVGIAIVFLMTNFINNQVKELNSQITTTSK